MLLTEPVMPSELYPLITIFRPFLRWWRNYWIHQGRKFDIEFWRHHVNIPGKIRSGGNVTFDRISRHNKLLVNLRSLGKREISLRIPSTFRFSAVLCGAHGYIFRPINQSIPCACSTYPPERGVLCNDWCSKHKKTTFLRCSVFSLANNIRIHLHILTNVKYHGLTFD